MKGVRASIQSLIHGVIECRLALSLGISAAACIVFHSLWPWPAGNSLLQMIALERPSVYLVVARGYDLFQFTTPFLICSMLFSLLYVHLYRRETVTADGALPSYESPATRRKLSFVLGEVHHQLRPEPSSAPIWLEIPERGLYTGIAVIGSIGSGKTQGVILPAMRQLFAYRAQDPARRLSGIVLEVKGDLCRQLRKILAQCGRENDYVEVSLDGPIRYNPLNNTLDPYAQAFNIASVITAIWGKGKEPFWQQSYTDLVRYVILLHRVRDGYVTLLDVFLTVISPGHLEKILVETGAKFSAASFIGIAPEVYLTNNDTLAPFGFEMDRRTNQFIAPCSEPLEKLLGDLPEVEARVYVRKAYVVEQRDRWQSVQYWYWEHWKFFRSEVKTSIVQGIAVFLSLFETDPDVRRVFCPPKELYQGKTCPADPNGRVMPPFEELIEQGKIVGLNFPVALNPALAKTIGTMMKVDYQRAVQLRIPRMDKAKMDREPDKHFRPTVFICDEYQNFATVGGDNPTGDERFLSISRQPKCIPIVATQSISSLKEALPNEGVKTLLQAFRTKVFLTTSDPDTARFASELCGKVDRTRISYTVSESSANANVGWLSGRTSANKGSVSASKQYQKQKEPLFDERVFFELKNAQSVVVAFDGVTPLPATYCYLKPDFLPLSMTWFEQERAAFRPEAIRP
jgi:hypothetical protein